MQSEVPGSKIAGKLQTERDWIPEVRKSKFCRGKVSFAVEKNVLPWKSKFCREKVSFAVAGMGHRKKGTACSLLSSYVGRQPQLNKLIQSPHYLCIQSPP